MPRAHTAAAAPAFADAHCESHPAHSLDVARCLAKVNDVLSWVGWVRLAAMYKVMELSVFPAFSINVSSRFCFVWAGISGSEASYISGVDAVAGGGVDDVEAEADGVVDRTSGTDLLIRVS